MTRSRPVIGLTSDMRVEKRTIAFLFDSYYRRVEEAGGLPLQIPPLADPDLVPEVLAAVDGIVVVGGEDIDPRVYGEEPLPTHKELPAGRGDFDLALAGRLLEERTPALGICYGCQLLAVASGGSLVQDIPSQVPDALAHGGAYPDLPTHPIDIVPGTRLAAIVEASGRVEAGGSGGASGSAGSARRIEVNSAHHQAPRSVGEGLRISARSPDGVVEAIESIGERFLIGVEWHPDLMQSRPEQRSLFEALVAAAAAEAGES